MWRAVDGMRRQIAQRVLRGLLAHVGIGLADDREGAGLAPLNAIDELAGFPWPVERADRPAGDQAREIGDVVLAVATIDAEGVQLKDFAREIFVEAAACG